MRVYRGGSGSEPQLLGSESRWGFGAGLAECDRGGRGTGHGAVRDSVAEDRYRCSLGARRANEVGRTRQRSSFFGRAGSTRSSADTIGLSIGDLRFYCRRWSIAPFDQASGGSLDEDEVLAVFGLVFPGEPVGSAFFIDPAVVPTGIAFQPVFHANR